MLATAGIDIDIGVVGAADVKVATEPPVETEAVGANDIAGLMVGNWTVGLGWAGWTAGCSVWACCTVGNVRSCKRPSDNLISCWPKMKRIKNEFIW